MRNLDVRREIMIERDLKGRGIRDPAVLAAMREVPREEFVPAELAEHSYDDYPLPIDEGQTISQPYMVAYMAESLELAPTDRVLEIGTGSGYSAAVLSRLVAEVFTVERFTALADSAGERLQRLGYDNIRIFVGDGTLGWPEHAPYNAIVVTAGAPRVPEPHLEQLVIGGRLVVPVGPNRLVQTLIRVRRVKTDEYRQENLMAVQFVPLIGAAGW
ncbi:MAG TPA: protein-L-isoaspartate(D-aspartate) O-methyltransferase [Geobacteraceae bacterium]|nr:protein-L-isoaspartate(D-aspartate) O-methyltransferase [Geobacteraceae bacterium]